MISGTEARNYIATLAEMRQACRNAGTAAMRDDDMQMRTVANDALAKIDSAEWQMTQLALLLESREATP